MSSGCIVQQLRSMRTFFVLALIVTLGATSFLALVWSRGEQDNQQGALSCKIVGCGTHRAVVWTRVEVKGASTPALAHHQDIFSRDDVFITMIDPGPKDLSCTLPPGYYAIGDVYLMYRGKWMNGCYEDNGRHYAHVRTARRRTCYEDNVGNVYPVLTGKLGIADVRFLDMEIQQLPPGHFYGGFLHHFSSEVHISVAQGKFNFTSGDFKLHVDTTVYV